MSIEQEYIDKIQEIKQHQDKLTDWEKGFIFGDGDSTPIDTRPNLSISQKAIVDRVYQQRVKGVNQEAVTEIAMNNNRIRASKTETNQFAVHVDGNVIGPTVSQREAVAIVGWLSDSIDKLSPKTAEAF